MSFMITFADRFSCRPGPEKPMLITPEAGFGNTVIWPVGPVRDSGIATGGSYIGR